MKPSSKSAAPGTTGSPTRRDGGGGLVGSVLDAGPVVAMSFWFFFWVIVASAGAACGVAATILWMVSPGRVWAVLPAWGAVVAAQGVGILASRPWIPRHIGRWATVWLAGRGVSVAGLFVAGGLLYSTLRPDPLAFGLAAAGAYFVSLMAEVWAFRRQVRGRVGPAPC